MGDLEKFNKRQKDLTSTTSNNDDHLDKARAERAYKAAQKEKGEKRTIGSLSGVAGIGFIYAGITGVNSWLSIFFYFLVLLVLFLLAVIYVADLISRLPFKAKWNFHNNFFKLFKLSPMLALGILYFTSMFPSVIVDKYFTERVSLTYIAAILGCIYLFFYYSFRPNPKKLEKADDFTDKKEYQKLNNSHSIIRYLLTIIGVISTSITVLLTVVLIPTSYKRAPTHSFKDALKVPELFKFLDNQEEGKNHIKSFTNI